MAWITIPKFGMNGLLSVIKVPPLAAWLALLVFMLIGIVTNPIQLHFPASGLCDSKVSNQLRPVALLKDTRHLTPSIPKTEPKAMTSNNVATTPQKVAENMSSLPQILNNKTKDTAKQPEVPAVKAT